MKDKVTIFKARKDMWKQNEEILIKCKMNVTVYPGFQQISKHESVSVHPRQVPLAHSAVLGPASQLTGPTRGYLCYRNITHS
jgi:hypothetical protein